MGLSVEQKFAGFGWAKHNNIERVALGEFIATSSNLGEVCVLAEREGYKLKYAGIVNDISEVNSNGTPRVALLVEDPTGRKGIIVRRSSLKYAEEETPPTYEFYPDGSCSFRS